MFLLVKSDSQLFCYIHPDLTVSKSHCRNSEWNLAAQNGSLYFFVLLLFVCLFPHDSTAVDLTSPVLTFHAK